MAASRGNDQSDSDLLVLINLIETHKKGLSLDASSRNERKEKARQELKNLLLAVSTEPEDAEKLSYEAYQKYLYIRDVTPRIKAEALLASLENLSFRSKEAQKGKLLKSDTEKAVKDILKQYYYLKSLNEAILLITQIQEANGPIMNYEIAHKGQFPALTIGKLINANPELTSDDYQELYRFACEARDLANPGLSKDEKNPEEPKILSIKPVRDTSLGNDEINKRTELLEKALPALQKVVDDLMKQQGNMKVKFLSGDADEKTRMAFNEQQKQSPSTPPPRKKS